MRYSATVNARVQTSVEIEADSLEEAFSKAKNLSWSDIMPITWPEDGVLYLAGVVECSNEGILLTNEN